MQRYGRSRADRTAKSAGSWEEVICASIATHQSYQVRFGARSEGNVKRIPLAICLAATIAISGSALAEEVPTVPHATAEVQLTAQHPVGLLPEGLRFDSHGSWVITDGLFAGATGTGIDYVLLRHDGIGVLYIRAHIVTPDGMPVAVKMEGFLVTDAAVTLPLEAWLAPDFEMPAGDLPAHGVAWFETMAPQYAFVNHTVFGFHGTANPATGQVRFTFRSLAE